MVQSPDVKIELKSRLFPALAVVFFLFQIFDPYKGWMALLIGVGGAWLLAFLWVRSLAAGLRFEREYRYGWAKVGDLMVERFYLSNKGWAEALYVVVEDHSSLPGYQGDKVTSVAGRSVKSWVKRNYCNLRGLYTFGPTSLHSGDPFGIYRVSIEFPQSESVLVLPPVVTLPSISIAPGERVGEGRVQTFALERSVSSASLREYVPGDNLRAIHWAQSARRDDLFVRVFDSTHSSDWWIILDLDRDAHIGVGESSTEEHAVILAASLANRGWKMGRSVGLVAQGERNAWLPPKFGAAQYWEIMRSLALASPNSERLSRVLARTQAALAQRTSVILITPAVDGEWLDALVAMMRRGIAITVLLLDRPAFGGEGDPNKALATLAAWGAKSYLVSPDVITMPDFRIDQEELATPITSLDLDGRPPGPNGKPPRS